MNIPKYEDTEPIAPRYEDTEPIEEKSLAGFGKNLVQDVKGTAVGLAGLGKDLLFDPVGTTYKTVKAIPSALVGEGKRLGIGELITGHPIKAAGKFGEALYEKPLTTALDVLPAVGAAGKALGIGGKAVRGAGLAAEAGEAAELAGAAGKVGEIAAGAGKAEKLAGIAKEGLDIPPAPWAKSQEAFSTLKSKIPPIAKGPLEEAMTFAKGKYGDVIKKTGIPKAADTASKYLIDIGRDFTAKQLGAKFGQLKKLQKNIGMDATEELMDFAQERGYVSPKTGSIGMYEKVLADQADAGSTIGGLRKLAAERGAVHDMPSLIEQIQTKFARKYGKGMHSGEGSTFGKALEEISDVQPTADAMAEKISALFSQSKNLDKLKQPSGAYADVARELRAANEALLAKHLNPQELAFYKKSLSDYGKTTQIREFVTGKKLSDMGGRLPPGSGILRRGFQKGLDVIGYKVGAKLAKDMGEWIAKNPEKIAHPKEIFSHLVDEAVEMMDDFGNPLE